MSASQPSDHHSGAESLLRWIESLEGQTGGPLEVRRDAAGLEVALVEGAALEMDLGASGADSAGDLAARVHLAASLDRLLGALQAPLIGKPGAVARLASISATPSLNDTLRVALVLSAGACGFASFDLAGTRVHWETRPKIRGTDWVGLLALARGWPSLGLGAEGDHERPADRSLAEVLVRAYVGAVRRLLHMDPSAERVPGGGLRRAYDPRAEVLRGRLRGQLNRPAYLQQVARGRPDRVPCRFHAHDLDHLPNRALRWGLHLCQALLGGIRAAARAELHTQLREADARFAGVSWERVTRSDLPALRHPPRALRAYEQTGALPLARLLLTHAELGGPAGGPTSVALAFDMPSLFERAFAQATADRLGCAHGHVAQAQWRVHLKTGEGSVWRDGTNDLRPDLYVRGEGERPALVADTKWKAVTTTRSDGADAATRDDESDPQALVDGLAFKVKREDLYQVLAYALTARGLQPEHEVRVALVYPLPSTARAEALAATLCWRAPGEAVHPWLQMQVVGWPMDALEGGLTTLLRTLQVA